MPGKAETSSKRRRPGADGARRRAAWNNAIPDRADDAKRKRQALIAEAARAFGHRGFHNVSLDEVAIALNVSKPTLYNYVSSKHELLYECYNLSLDLGDVAVQQALSQPGNSFEKLTRFMTLYIEMLTEHLGPAAVFYEFYSMRPDDREKIQKRRRQFDRMFRELITKGIEDGSIAECDPRLAVVWFMSAISSIPRWYDPKGEKTGHDIAEAFTSFLRNGIGHKPAR